MPMPEWFWNLAFFVAGYGVCFFIVGSINYCIYGEWTTILPARPWFIEHKPNATAQERHKELLEAYRAINRSGGKRLELEQDRMIDHVFKLDTDANPELKK